jgi:hypothetical protein
MNKKQRQRKKSKHTTPSNDLLESIFSEEENSRKKFCI